MFTITPFGMIPKMKPFQVVGIFEKQSSLVDSFFAYIPLTVGQKFFDAQGTVTGVELVVGPVNDPALTMDDSGLLIRQVGFGPGDKGPFAHLLARPESAAARRGVTKARLLMGALLAWAVVRRRSAGISSLRRSIPTPNWGPRAGTAILSSKGTSPTPWFSTTRRPTPCRSSI